LEGACFCALLRLEHGALAARRCVSVLVWHCALVALVALRATALVVSYGKFRKKIWHELF
jgi:hypothetical protein